MRRTMSFGYEGDDGLGDRLLAAVLRGEKTGFIGMNKSCSQQTARALVEDFNAGRLVAR